MPETFIPSSYVKALENLKTHDWSAVVPFKDTVAVVAGPGRIYTSEDAVATAVWARGKAERNG